jgi:hypothetical protein
MISRSFTITTNIHFVVEHLQADHIFEITTHVCIYLNTRSHPRGHLLINKGREAERCELRISKDKIDIEAKAINKIK